MRIAFFHSGWDLYGASRSLLHLASALRRDGHEVLALLPQPGPLSVALRAADVRVEDRVGLHCLHRAEFRFPQVLRFLGGLPISVVRSHRALRAFRPDLVHTNTGTVLTGALSAKLAGVPHLWHVRDMFDEFGALWNVYGRWILASSRRVVCVSRAVSAQFDLFPGAADKVWTVNSGLPPDEFLPPPGGWALPAAELRRKWGVGETECTIGILGRIKLGRKGHEVLMRAVRKLLDAHHPSAVIARRKFRLVIVGAPFPGNEAHEMRLRELVRELGSAEHVVFAGELEDPRPAYAALDVVVLASARPEPFSGVVVEAMAMGKPVVGTANGGTVEQIEDGVTGFLVPPNDPGAMADALARLLADPALRAQMGEAGRRRFAAKFGFDEMYRRLLAIYAEAIVKK